MSSATFRCRWCWRREASAWRCSFADGGSRECRSSIGSRARLSRRCRRLARSPDGKTLYASGGNDDSIFVYRWNGTEATAGGKIELVEKPKPDPKEKAKEYDGTQYPAGIAISADGRFLFVAENLADSLAVVDLASGKVVQRVLT